MQYFHCKIMCFLVLLFFASRSLWLFSHTQHTQEEKKNLPLSPEQTIFQENKGQFTDLQKNPINDVLFKAEQPNLTLWIHKQGYTLMPFRITKFSDEEKTKIHPTLHEKTIEIAWERIEVTLKNALINAQRVIKNDSSAIEYYYYLPHHTHQPVKTKNYGNIIFREVYPFIDWRWQKAEGEGFKYDFIVRDFSHINEIQLQIDSKHAPYINEKGELIIPCRQDEIKEKTPVCTDASGKIIPCYFRILQQEKIILHNDTGYRTLLSFLIHATPSNISLPLIIDPHLVWSTFFGGNSLDGPMSLVTDSAENLFITGYVASVDFPVVSNNQFFQGTKSISTDAFIAKFNSTLQAEWITYYGGNNMDDAYAINIDHQQNILITGRTRSTNFPTFNGGGYYQASLQGDFDAFLLKFTNQGQLLHATYLGGNQRDIASGIVALPGGKVILTGSTRSTNFPITSTFPNAYLVNQNNGATDIFLCYFDSSLSLLHSTYIGGTGHDHGYAICKTPSQHIVLCGSSESGNFYTYGGNGGYLSSSLSGLSDGIIMEFDSNAQLLWSTYLGGTNEEYFYSIDCSDNNEVIICGISNSINFPTTSPNNAFLQSAHAGLFDAVITLFSPTRQIQWSSYFGSSNNEYFSSFQNIAFDECGNFYFSMYSGNNSFPHLQNSCDQGYMDNSYNGGANDLILSAFSSQYDLLWCTYVGGSGNDLREPLFYHNHHLYMTGEWVNVTQPNSYPLVPYSSISFFDGSYNGTDDGFIQKYHIAESLFNASLTLTMPTCYNTCDGAAFLNIQNQSLCNLQILWSTGDTQNTVIYDLCAGNYWVNLSLPVFCKDTTLYFVIENPPPVYSSLNLQSTQPICEYDSLFLYSAVSNLSFLQYQWTGPNNFSSSEPTIETDTLSSLYSGTFFLSVQDSLGCIYHDSTQVIIYPLPNANALCYPACSGTPSYLQAYPASSNDTISSYLWVINTDTLAGQNLYYIFPPFSTYATLIIQSLHGCSRTMIVPVETYNPPTASFTFDTVCLHTPTHFYSLATDSQYTITNQWWFYQGQLIGSSPSLFYTFPLAGNHLVTLIVSSDKGCYDTISRFVTVLPLPDAGFIISDTAGCSPFCTTFTYEGYDVNNTNTLELEWTIDHQTYTQTSIQHCFANDQILSPLFYDVMLTVKDTNHCVNTEIKPNAIIVYPNPVTDFDIIPDSLVQSIFSPSFSFYNKSKAATLYYWQFGDKSFSYEVHPTHIYADTGYFTVELTAYNQYGCQDTATKRVRILPEFALFIPNAFTPDGDGHNDFWFLQGIGVYSIQIYVFNRWGELIWQSESLSEKWDGTHKGQPAPMGTYVYRIFAENYKQMIKEFIGNVYLIR